MTTVGKLQMQRKREGARGSEDGNVKENYVHRGQTMDDHNEEKSSEAHT
jgi:hypothetical protein